MNKRLGAVLLTVVGALLLIIISCGGSDSELREPSSFSNDFPAPYTAVMRFSGEDRLVRYGIERSFSSNPDSTLYFFTYTAEKTKGHMWIIEDDETEKILMVLFENDHRLFFVGDTEGIAMEKNGRQIYPRFPSDILRNRWFEDAEEVLPQIKQAWRCENLPPFKPC